MSDIIDNDDRPEWARKYYGIDGKEMSAAHARTLPSEQVFVLPPFTVNSVTNGGISDIVSPDAPVTTNERGGSQSHVPVRFDLLDAKALFAAAAVLNEGAEKYSPGNWRLISVRDHLNHLLMHTYAYLSGDRTDDHLSHAVCRAIFALGVELDPDGNPEQDQT